MKQRKRREDWSQGAEKDQAVSSLSGRESAGASSQRPTPACPIQESHLASSDKEDENGKHSGAVLGRGGRTAYAG
eukprot:1332917-Rhodomonas_salina.1